MRSIAHVFAGVSVITLTSLALTGCSPVTDGACTNPLGDGIASAVEATGPVGTPPTVDFPLPLVGNDASTAIIEPGDGRMIRSGNYVDFEAVVLNGTDQSILTSTPYGANGASAQRISITEGATVLADSFLCHREGERFALVATIGDVFGQAVGNGVDPADTAVIVFDVMKVYPRAAEGTLQFGVDGMPAVTSAPDGRPGLAIPTTTPPVDLRVATLIKGNGDIVGEGDTVVANYLGATWDGTVFDNTWDKDQPRNLVAQSFIDNGGVGVVPGFATALIGQTVGSRVLVSIPPSQGYPAGQQPQSIPDGATLVFVVDILGLP